MLVAAANGRHTVRHSMLACWSTARIGMLASAAHLRISACCVLVWHSSSGDALLSSIGAGVHSRLPRQVLRPQRQPAHQPLASQPAKPRPLRSRHHPSRASRQPRCRQVPRGAGWQRLAQSSNRRLLGRRGRGRVQGSATLTLCCPRARPQGCHQWASPLTTLWAGSDKCRG